MNIAFWLMRIAQIAPERPALFDGKNCVADYATFHEKACRLAGWLQDQSVEPGDRVGVFLKNTPEYLIVLYGIWYAGAVAVPINAKLHARECAWILGNARASICFASPEVVDEVAGHVGPCRVAPVPSPNWRSAETADAIDPVARSSDDLAWLFYTSGTTGRPKGVEITHRMLISMSQCYQTDVEAVCPEDAALYAAPMSHGAGLYNMMHVRAGARHICPPSRGFDPSEILDLAVHHGRIHMFAAPTMVKRLTDVAKSSLMKGVGLRSIIYAGGPMYETDVLEAVDWFGPVFAQIYGQGECPMGITALTKEDVAERKGDRWRARVNSVGRAQSAVEVQIGDDHGQALPAGETGEVMVRGDIVMPGYWRNPEATASTLVDGWLRTGDMGVIDVDGYLTLKDRSKDVIISGGSNIYPREVEDALISHAAVAEAAVVGRDHPEWGEEVVAFVVPQAGCSPTADTLDAHCLAQIARFKRPKDYHVVSELPKNNYGKVLKTDLRNRLKR